MPNSILGYNITPQGNVPIVQPPGTLTPYVPSDPSVFIAQHSRPTAMVAGGGGVGGGAAGTGGYSGLSGYPGYEQLAAMAKGQVAPGTISLLQQQGAERGIGTGMPGSPASNAAYLRTLGQTSEENILKAQGILSPLYQQQVSEAGQTSRLGMSLGAQMEQLIFSEDAATKRQGAALASQQAIAQMQEAGLDYRQSQALGAAMQQLIVSNNYQDQRQAADLAAAMDRLKVGAANQLDMQKIQNAAQYGLQVLSGSQALQREQLQAGTQLGLAGLQNTAAMQRLQYSTAAEQQNLASQIASQQQMQTQQLAQQKALEAQKNALQKYITDEQMKLGYAGVYNRGGYGLGGYGQRGGLGEGAGGTPPTAGPTVSLVDPNRPKTGASYAPERTFDWVTQSYSDVTPSPLEQFWSASYPNYMPTSRGTMYMGTVGGYAATPSRGAEQVYYDPAIDDYMTADEWEMFYGTPPDVPPENQPQ